MQQLPQSLCCAQSTPVGAPATRWNVITFEGFGRVQPSNRNAIKTARMGTYYDVGPITFAPNTPQIAPTREDGWTTGVSKRVTHGVICPQGWLQLQPFAVQQAVEKTLIPMRHEGC